MAIPAGTGKPVVSVIVVSDFESGKERGWADLRATLQGLAQQDFDGSVEIVVVESPELLAGMPSDLPEVLPQARFVTAVGDRCYQLMWAGLGATTADIVAILEGDCAPRRGWLRACVNLMRNYPDAAAACGRTVYPGTGLFNRCMALITRSFVESSTISRTRHLTHNNCVFRRDTLIAHPFPEAIGPHMSSLHAQAIERSSGHIYFDPDMEIVHAYSGWEHERGMRHSLGYAVVRVRQQNPASPYAWVIHLGILSVPFFILLRALNACWQCVRNRRRFGVAWFELPVAFVLSFAATSLEARGMWNALRGLSVPANEYR